MYMYVNIEMSESFDLLILCTIVTDSGSLHINSINYTFRAETMLSW